MRYILRMMHPNSINLPLSTRFQPGSSGNRGGRPRTVDVRTRAVAAAQLVALEGLIDRALSGDASALALLLAGNASPVPQRASQDAQVGIPGIYAVLDDIDDAIPPGIAIPHNLPPCRAALARYMAYRAQVAADIARLEGARDKLQLELARADAVKLQNEQDFEAQAASLAESLQAGIEFVCSAFVRKAEPLPDARLVRAALAKLETELAAKQALADRIQDRYSEFVNAALREHGASLAAEYTALIDQLRGTICKLYSLDLASGVGRVGDPLASVPGFAICGQSSRPRQVGPSPEAVGAAVASWKALGRAWSQDPKTPASKHLKFRLRDREAVRFTT